jgi:hypothetical protein
MNDAPNSRPARQPDHSTPEHKRIDGLLDDDQLDPSQRAVIGEYAPPRTGHDGSVVYVDDDLGGLVESYDDD